jgi:uncharacterized glyoxalase superfamily protein PhnB/GNAT superfamily N-acetyltransferase
MNDVESPSPLKSSEAIFAVADVVGTVKFYREILGFNRQWLWGDPPTFAGVAWGAVQIMLCQQTELSRKVEGHMHMFFTEGDIDALYARHVAAGAPIIEPIENKPWGIREYTVRDPNGYHLRFGGPANYQPPPSASVTLPDYIRIVERMPTLEEYDHLIGAVGWTKHPQSMQAALQNSVFAVVALDTRADPPTAVGMVRVVGDGARFFYIQDVAVLPAYQGQRIGTSMMQVVMTQLRAIAPQGWASIGLFTRKPKFYERFGFQSGLGMSMSV